MGAIDRHLAELKLDLPQVKAPVANYAPAVGVSSLPLDATVEASAVFAVT